MGPRMMSQNDENDVEVAAPSDDDGNPNPDVEDAPRPATDRLDSAELTPASSLAAAAAFASAHSPVAGCPARSKG